MESLTASSTENIQDTNPGTVNYFSKGLQNKLINADCFDVFPQIPDNSVDLIISDLPDGTTACKWDCILPFEPLWEQYKRIIKPNSAIVLTASQPFTSKLVMSNLKWFKYEWIWEKPQGVNPFASKYQPLNNIENILIYYKETCIYNPQLEDGKPYKIIRDRKERLMEVTGTVMKQTETINAGFRLPKRILRFNFDRGLHPTQKPVALFEYLIRTYTNPNALILDNCSGSATTAIAAINTNRNFICIEKDSDYHQTALNRVNAHINILLEKAKKNA